ncbi:MAG: hypothetical protein ACO3E1_06330 [Flavobacteriales bacterium]
MMNHIQIIFRAFTLLTLLSFISCSQYETILTSQKPPSKLDTTEQKDTINKPTENQELTIEELYKEKPYDFDTILKNGYKLKFEYFKENLSSPIEMRLLLVKGNKLIANLNIVGAELPHKNLGYIGTDFDDYFAFVQSFGSGNPHYMQFLRKSDAKEIVKGYIVDGDDKNEILLYCNDGDSLMFFDIRKMKNNFIADLNTCKYITSPVSQLSGSLKIKNVTMQQIQIEIIQENNKTINKSYNR